MMLPPPSSTLFPYTTLFRSHLDPGPRRHAEERQDDEDHGRHDRPRDLEGRAAVRVPRRSTGSVAVDHDEHQHRDEHEDERRADRKSTRLNSSHITISYAVFC